MLIPMMVAIVLVVVIHPEQHSLSVHVVAFVAVRIMSPHHTGTKNRVTGSCHRPILMTSSSVTYSPTRIFVVARGEEEKEEEKKDPEKGDDWVSLLPRHSRSSVLLTLTSMPSFQAFVRGESSVFHSSRAFSSTLKEEEEEEDIISHNSSNNDGSQILSAIQEDVRLLKAMGVGSAAGVVSNPDGVPPIRQGVTQLWLQVPSHSEADESNNDEPHATTRRSSSSSLMAGNLDGRAHLFRLVEGLRLALEEDSYSTSSTTASTTRRRRLPPDQVELSYLWYDGSSTTAGAGAGAGQQGAYYGRHIDTPWIPPTTTSSIARRRRVRCVSFLLYLGGDTDEPWNVKDHGGQLRIYMDRPLPTDAVRGISGAANDDNDNNDDDDNEGHVDVIPECGTLVLFDSAIVPHEVLPTRRDRLAVVGWFGGTQEEINMIHKSEATPRHSNI